MNRSRPSELNIGKHVILVLSGESSLFSLAHATMSFFPLNFNRTFDRLEQDGDLTCKYSGFVGKIFENY